jgi:predicted PurR-regulated permease PerM
MAAMPPDTPRMVRIPRWVQLVGLPLILVGAWQFMSAVSHAMFIFVVAALIAILLNPIVRAFCALKIPRAGGVSSSTSRSRSRSWPWACWPGR